MGALLVSAESGPNLCTHICSSLSWDITERQLVGLISPQCVHNIHNFAGRSLLDRCSHDYCNGPHWKFDFALQLSLGNISDAPPTKTFYADCGQPLRHRTDSRYSRVWKGSKPVPNSSLLQGLALPLLKLPLSIWSRSTALSAPKATLKPTGFQRMAFTHCSVCHITPLEKGKSIYQTTA
jgi:hypothetical protein